MDRPADSLMNRKDRRLRGATDVERICAYSVPVPESGCWLWFKGVNHAGYGVTHKGLAHRLSWTAFRGEIPGGMHVLHKCDTRCCVNPNHLFLGTNYDNVQDKIRKGRPMGGAGGSKNPSAKLNEEDVACIRRCTNTNVELADILGMNPVSISRIRNYHLWRNA